MRARTVPPVAPDPLPPVPPPSVLGRPMLLALGSSLFWGLSAFIAGRRGRSVPTPLLIAASQGLGVPIMLVVLAVTGAQAPPTRALLFGALGGVASILGLGGLYRGLAVARAAVVAPTAAIVSVTLPTLVDLARGTPLSARTWAGLVLGLVATTLLSGPRTGGTVSAERSGLGYGIASGLGFAGFALAFDLVGPGAGQWPILTARLATAGVLLLAMLVLGAGLDRHPTPVLPALREGAVPIGAIGLLEVGGALLYLTALGVGPLSVVVVLGSLYPVVTVLLARFVLHQRLGAIGGIGLVAGATSVVLLVLG
ncbi:MAG: hypothetical protein RLZZ272_48 [Actinomycetota bacterium]